MLNYKEAQKILEANARSFGKEKIGLDQADGRTLAETILADRDYPPFNRSSMDGYAIHHSDFERGIRQFSIVETIYAGDIATRSLSSGECYKIMTGAPVPTGADTVVRKEDVEEDAGKIHIRLASCHPFQSIARQGEDLKSGDMVLHRACRCEAPVMGLLASLGKNELLVERLPRVALLTTGNEVVPIDAPVNPAQIRNSNRWLLQSLLKKWGIVPALVEHVPDDRQALKEVLGRVLHGPDSDPGPHGSGASPGLPFDIIILSGGVSAGDADYVPGVLDELKVQNLFYKLAIKPGKPVWCGMKPAPGAAAPVTPISKGSTTIPGNDIAPSTIIFALPGNPFSCLVNFMLLIRPYLHACFGLPAPVQMALPLRESKKKNTPLDEFFPVRSGGSPETRGASESPGNSGTSESSGIPGSPAGLTPIRINSSGDIRLGLGADGLALHPAGRGDLPEGALVFYYAL
ncbi:MAG TPA: molybdopterin molybdotransferase MoeA [Puia sp.]|nr:molybdopterin molybdotransferase MoeA [Puia sp.]